MQVAVICDGVHPYVIGGMQRHTYYLVKYLSKLGIKVTLVHYNNSNLDIQKLDIYSEDERKNIENIVLQFPKSDGLPGHYVRASYKYSVLCFNAIKERINEFDFIYTKGFSGWKLIKEKKSNKNWPPIGVKFHGYEMFQKQADKRSFLKSLILRRPVRWISLNADYVFSYGSKITEIIKSLGITTGRIIEIPAGIEADWIRNDQPQLQNIRTFTYLGRYERRKGIEELNSSILKLISKGFHFKFNFIGPFEENQKIKHPSVTYFGSITDNHRISEILDSSDYLVCPSWSEGMPNVILEGMSRACAILGTDVGATSIMVSESNGFLIEAGNVEILTQTLIQAIETSDAKLMSFKLHSLEKIKEEFIYDKIQIKLMNSIQKIIQ